MNTIDLPLGVINITKQALLQKAVGCVSGFVGQWEHSDNRAYSAQLIKLPRAELSKSSQSWYCLSRVEPKGSNLLSWAKKLEYDIVLAKP